MAFGDNLQDYNASPLVPEEWSVDDWMFQEPWTPPASIIDEQTVSEAREHDQNAVPAVPATAPMLASPSYAVQTPPASQGDDFDASRIYSLLDFSEEPQQYGQDTIPAPATEDGYQFVNPMDLVNGPQLQPQQTLQGGLPNTTLPQFLPLAAQGQHTSASQPAPQPPALSVPQPQQATQGGLSNATNPQAGAAFPPLPVLVQLAGGRYSCPNCANKVFGTKQLAQSHLMGVHGEASGLPLLQCGNCHRGITRDPANMRRHERCCRGRAAKYRCHKCGRESTSKYNMDRHIVTCRHVQPAQQ
jgi:hypothetical protein